MNPNIRLVAAAQQLDQLRNEYAIITIDGSQSKTLRQFYEHIAKAMEFPDYFGFNLDSLDELLNDLEWIADEKIALHFTHPEQLISQERDPKKLVSLLNLLDATAEDWKWVDEEDDIDKKELVLLFDDSPKIRQLLDDEEIGYEILEG